jgi:predicted transcriptional regulator
MAKNLHAVLSRRERQIVDIIYQLGRATAAEVGKALPGEPADSTVRTQLRVLESKGHIRHEDDGQRYVYLPVVPRRVVSRSALKHVVNTFFDGSIEKVVAALLGPDGSRLSDEELERIADIVAKAKAEEKR